MKTTQLFTSLIVAITLVFFGAGFLQTAQAQNSCDSPEFQITSDKEVLGLVGESFSYYIVTENDVNYELASPLPAGIQFSNGQLSGTPQSAGDHQINFVASNSCGSTTQTIQLSVVSSTGSSTGSASETTSSDSGAPAEGVRLDDVPETGIIADSALTVSFYLLALLFMAGWFVRNVFRREGTKSVQPVSGRIEPQNKARKSKNRQSQAHKRTRDRFSDGIRRGR